jgi:competence protein ComEC
LAGAVRGRHVGALLTGPLDSPATGSLIVHAVARQLALTVRVPAVGGRFDVGAVHLDVLAPPYAFTGTRSDPNNSSLVLRATVGGVRILLTGDAEVEEQDWLLSSGQDLRADVLKVQHHGSAYSDPAFLAAVHASVGVISVGVHNDYGQPSPLLLGELARLGVPALRTDRDGDVAVAVAGGRLQTVVHGVRASTPGLAAARIGEFVVDARVAACPHALSPRARPVRDRRSCRCSATRSCSSIAPSARSPPGQPRSLIRAVSPAIAAPCLIQGAIGRRVMVHVRAAGEVTVLVRIPQGLRWAVRPGVARRGTAT